MTGASFFFEGEAIAFRPGQSVAAALAAACRMELRAAGDGAARGVFCGMGICQDCVVAIDGLAGQRACLTAARAGADIRRQGFPSPAPAPAPVAALSYADLPREVADVLVVGGGAGGLTAAAALARAGLSVVLLDERKVAGGQYYKQPAAALGAAPLDRQQADGAALVAEAVAAGADLRVGVEAWGPAEPHAGMAGVLATGPAGTRAIHGRRLVIAAGAYERPLMVPGWTLPGVMTVGALQTLWRSDRTLAGRRILLAANGPLALQVACEARAAGAGHVALAEAADAVSPVRLAALLRMAAASPGLAATGLGLLARAAVSGIRLRFGRVLRRVRAVDGGLCAEIAARDGTRAEEFAVDIVAMGYGFHPAAELLRAFGAAQDADPRDGGLRTRRDATCETSQPGLYAVGDCAGPGGAPAARAEGVIAAAAIAAGLGAGDAALAAAAAQARRALARHRRFQAALWDLYAAPWPGLSFAEDTTLVCRCENVTRAALDAAIAEGGGIGSVKRRTRCGMGACQGRYCGPALARRVAEARGAALSEDGYFAPRFPTKPVRIADIVGGVRKG